MPHFLDDAIATLRRERDRWRTSHGDRSEAHDTAAAILTKIAESGASHEEVKTHLAESDDDAQQTPPVLTDIRDRIEVVPPVVEPPPE